jgi:hypothetical protein
MIEPDRILEGIARTLETAVLPALGSGFARGQLHAVLDVISSLHGQLEPGGALLENEASMLSALAAEAAASLPEDLASRCRAYASDPPAGLAERLRAGRAIVCDIIAGGHADGGSLATAVDGYLTNDTILKAMALRPGRLAEISKG